MKSIAAIVGKDLAFGYWYNYLSEFRRIVIAGIQARLKAL
jgi:hypothetical protein